MIISKFSSRERALVIATILILFSTVSYGFIIEPLLRAYSDLSYRIATDAKKLEKNQRLIHMKDAIIAEYERYSKILRPTGSDEEEIASMLKVIEATARNDNVYILNIRPQPLKDEELYKIFSLELSAEAEIERLVRFIYDLQTGTDLLRVRRLTISAGSAKSGQLKALMIITKPAIHKTATNINKLSK